MNEDQSNENTLPEGNSQFSILNSQLNLSSQLNETRYGNILKILCDWISPWMLFVVAGRGMAKSSEIIADRVLEILHDMPGAPLAIIADTYVNLNANILDAVKLGWKRKGYYEGYHYVDGVRPPEDWLRKCSIIVSEFKHTIFFHNGSVLFKGSLDRPSLLAGKSVVHLFSDEAKYQPDAKIARTLPILRGDSTIYGDSTYFLGITATTDMPDTLAGEYDWILRYASRMDKDAILRIVDTFNYLNEYRIAWLNAKEEKERESLENEIKLWEERLRKVRHEQVFFFNASSLINIEILTIKYLRGLIESLDTEDFNKSVLGMRPSLKRDQRFYPRLTEVHFYTDGYNYDYYDTQEQLTESWRGLRYLRTSARLEAGLDVGNMLSLVIGQEQMAEYRVLKNFYAITPDWFRELADTFLDFFRNYPDKTLDLYYDRAANNFQKQGQDFAAKCKEALETDVHGRRTGWMVNLLSRGQGNLSMQLEYDFMNEILSEENPHLPKIRIDRHNCKELKSSLEGAPMAVKTLAGGKKSIIKVKTSERLEPKRLPMESTNFSDAFKYLLMRKGYLAKVRRKSKTTIHIPELM